MYPYAVEEMVQERLDEMHRLRRTDGRSAGDVAGWRSRAGRALASVAVAVAVPRSERATTRSRVGAALSIDVCH